nr:lipoxygenase homology domain-containing protein 1-like [Salvelinus alpinus]
MPSKEKKTAGTEETEEVDCNVEEKEPKPKGKIKSDANGDTKPDGAKKSKKHKSPEESEEEPEKERKKKGERHDKVKEKKENKKKKAEDDAEKGEGDEVIENEEEGDDEQNNNDTIKTKPKKKKSEEEDMTEGEVKEEKKKKKKKKLSSEGDQQGEEEMGSKGRKSKDGGKKKKKAQDEEPLLEDQEGEEEDSKKKKKKKPKKGSADSDEDKKDKKGKKGKKPKAKQVDYAEIYYNELMTYQTDSSDGYEEEYHKKKVYMRWDVTGDVRGAGTDANVFVTLFGDFGITPKVHLASKSRTAFEKNKTDVFRIKTHNVGPLKKLRIEHDNTGGLNASWFLDRVVVTDMNRPHLRFYFACNNWLSREEGDGLYVRDLLGSLNPMDVPKLPAGPNSPVVMSDSDPAEWAEQRSNLHVEDIDEPPLECSTLQEHLATVLQALGAVHDDVDLRMRRNLFAVPAGPNSPVVMSDSDPAEWLSSAAISTLKISMSPRSNAPPSRNTLPLFFRPLVPCMMMWILSWCHHPHVARHHLDIVHHRFGDPVTVYCPFTGIEQTFPCCKWLDEDEGDGLIERELYEMVSLRQKKLKKYPWSLWIWTSDVKGAGTDAQVFLQIYGDKGKSDEMRLESNSDSFEQAQLDKFMIEMPDIGKLTKARIWHEKRHPFAGWHFARATVMKTLTREKYSFNCGRWLDINEDDNEIVRELPATGALIPEPLLLLKYRITICTGRVSGGGTDASVFLNVIGDLGDTGDRLMFLSKNNVNKFEKGNADEFLTEAVSLGQVRRVRIGHDGRGGGCGWFLDKVLVREEGQPESAAIEFPCNRWLDRNEDDGQIVRELVPAGDGLRLHNVNYHISVKTGNINGASSDSKVFVKLYGEKGDTTRILLVVSDNDLSNYYETGQTDIFTVETYDIGQIHRLLIGHTNEGLRAGWFLDSVQIIVPVHGKQYQFPSHRWLCKDEADGKVEVEIYPSETLDIEKLINYEVTVVTGNMRNGGTNANVFCQIYGEEGKTELISLKSRSNNFERGTTEIYKIEALNVGKLFKIRIGHDGSGVSDGWFLETVDIKRLTMAMVQREVVKEKPKDDKKDKKKNKKKKKEEDEEEEYVTELQEVVESVTFPCHRWLARDEEDGEIVVELLPEDPGDLEENSYEVHVFTGPMWGAGTDANVYINIYGEIGDTGERKLRKSNNLNKFEKGQEDVFSMQAIDLGILKKLRIRHDNSQPHAAWFLDRVEIVDNKDDTTYYFPCKRWLAIDEDDGQIARELVPVDEAFMKKGEDDDDDDDDDEENSSATLGLEQKAMSTTFTMRVKTGDKKYAGTDANVFAILYGMKDDTGIIMLKASKLHKNKFEQAMIDEFTVEAVDIGTLKKIRIGHDNSGAASGWFLDWVEVDAPSLGQRLRFPCGRWLDKGEDDGAIVRDLFPADLQTELYTPFVPYEIKTFTSDLFAAGTDADVFIVLYGRDGVCTQQRSLCVNKRERTMYFERGAEDMFIVELEDVGDVIEKIRIGHDNRGLNGGWHLDRVEIRRLLRKGKGSETIIFPCERWLAKSEDDGETVRELVPSDIITEKLLRDGTLKVSEVEVEDALETHTYKVSVMTGDVYDAGTDANVFLTIYGDLGDTGERKLSKSETNGNKFERGAVDKFTIEAVDLGQVFRMKIRHDNSMMSADWYLDQVEVVDEDTEEVFLFLCERWLSRKREDRRIERMFYVKGYEGERESIQGSKKSSALIMKSVDSNMNKKKKKGEDIQKESTIIPYHFTISTGAENDASTCSRVYVIIMGPNHTQTQRLWLDLPGGKKCFESGSLESFEAHGADVGEIKKVEIIYEVTVVTGDVQNAGTDTQIYVSVFGTNGTTEEILLQKNEDRFERGQEDTFSLEVDDIAPLRKMRVRIDGSGSRPDWFLAKIIMRNLTTEEVSVFTYEEWLSKTKGPKRTMICEMAAVVDEEEMVEITTYIIQVKTSDIGGAGTDANVWIIVFGECGDTGTLALKECQKSNKFERKQTDVFRFPDVLSLGELSKVRVWHDNSGPAPGWHIEYIDVKDEALDRTFRFPCDRWLAQNEDDGQIMRELSCANNDILDLNEKTKYEIITTTADTDDAETKENVWIALEGKKGRSKEFMMENSSKKKRFLRGNKDKFEFSSKQLGDIAGICLGHTPKDGKKVKGEAFWHVEEVVVIEKVLGNRFIFICNALIPLSSKRDEFVTIECTKAIESFASKARSLVPVKYEIILITGDEKGAGTDANVFITIYGSNGDSGRRSLRQKFRNLFERGQTDRFLLEMLDMGELLRVCVEHDNTRLSPGWLLDRVEVTNTANGVTTIFLCGKWLNTKKADGQIFRVLYPKY